MTIIETLVAITIFAMTIVGVMGAIVVSVDASSKINYEYTATNIAKSRIERLRYMDFNLLTNAVETNSLVDNQGVPSETGEFIRNTIVNANYGGNGHLIEVRVEVYYIYRGAQNNVPATMSLLLSDIR